MLQKSSIFLGQYFQIHTHICTGIYTKGWAEENSRSDQCDRGSAEGGSKSVEIGREADNGHSLARLKPMNQVGGKADTCGGLSTETSFLFGNGAEGVVAVEPKAVFHGWR